MRRVHRKPGPVRQTPRGGTTPPPRRAFTLVELMVVIMVILVLVAILLPTVNRIRLNSQLGASRAVMKRKLKG